MPSFETYLVSPSVHEAGLFRPRLEATLAALKPASILIDVPAGDERAQINLIKALAPLAQEAGAAVLVNTSPQVAVRGGADGVHVASPLLIGAAREVLKGERIVGSGGLLSRHDAMDAGEAGADYVMFGEPRADGTAMSLSALVDRASWWAEVFETPCVAYAASLEAVLPMAMTRAEFVALGPWSFDDPDGARAAVSEAASSLAQTRKQPA
jgi:thiamine-phosphate pyrophosphorylase